jgi:hypothetical protein
MIFTPTMKVVREGRLMGLTVLDRKQWGSEPDGRPWPLAPNTRDVYSWRRAHREHHLIRPGRSSRPADTGVQHITVTLDHGNLTGDFRRDVQTVERIGFERFGSGISYNSVTDMSTGMIAVGMPIDAKGTHTVNALAKPGFSYDQNAVALGFAMLGMCNNGLGDKAIEAQGKWLAAHARCGYLTKGFDYLGHRYFANKGCPCDETVSKMDDIYRVFKKHV